MRLYHEGRENVKYRNFGDRTTANVQVVQVRGLVRGCAFMCESVASASAIGT